MAPKSKKPASLSIQDIVKRFGKQEVLRQVSFEVKPGEIYGLVGLNGAGKTTLIKIILGLLRQDTGSALINGKPASDPATRQELSFLPEKFQPSAMLYGHEFLKLTLAYYGKPYDKQLGHDAVATLDLDPLALDKKVAKYSKGMGQKLGLASAFLTQTPLLILDEPMSGLDPRARIHLKDAMLNYTKAGHTIFFTSHILSDMDEICDRITVLHEGTIRFTGTPATFKKKHGHEHLERAFLQAIDQAA